MRILLDTHMLGKQETGNERYWKNLSQAIAKYKKVEVLNYSPELNNGLYRIFLGFDKAIKRFRPDLIHVQNFAPFNKTVPLVTTVHDLCFKSYPRLFNLKTNLAFQFFFKRSLEQSDAIICVSNETKKQLLRAYKINERNIFVIYEAADKCFKYLEDKKGVALKLLKKFSLTGKYFLVVGNIQSRKLPYETIKAFKAIKENFTDINLVFVGHNKLGIKQTNRIKIFGYVTDEELNLLYNGSVGLIYLSLCEGFGLPIIEAMTTKTPVVCSNIPVFREVVGYNNALFVKNNRELVGALAILLKNKIIRKKYSLLGYKRSKFFSWEKTARETLKVYNWVLNS